MSNNKIDDIEVLEKVSGGADPEVGTQCFKYSPGDSVIVTAHPEYMDGIVAANKSIINGRCIDSIYFYFFDGFYDFYEDDLQMA